MNYLKSPLIRILITLIVGVTLVVWPDTALRYIVMLIGLLFLIPGIISLIFYLQTNQEGKGNTNRYLPIESIGSTLLGASLVIFPLFFVSFIMYVLAALLVLGGVYQLLILANNSKRMNVPTLFYFTPSLILIAGIIIFINPFSSLSSVLLLFGITTIVYGVTELINYIKFK